VMMEVEIECLPKYIPTNIEVDISGMHLGDIIHLSELKLPEGVSVLAILHDPEHDTAVVNIHVSKAISEDEEESVDAGEVPTATDEEGSDSED